MVLEHAPEHGFEREAVRSIAGKIGWSAKALRKWVRRFEIDAGRRAGLEPSVGSVGDLYGNALAETINGLFKTEVIRPNGPWRAIEKVEFATHAWVDGFNNRRLLHSVGDVPPAEFEAMYDEAQASPVREARLN